MAEPIRNIIIIDQTDLKCMLVEIRGAVIPDIKDHIMGGLVLVHTGVGDIREPAHSANSEKHSVYFLQPV